MSKFETKNALFEYFWERIFRKLSHISNQGTQNCKFAKFHE